MSQAFRKGSKVQFKIGRGVVTGKITEISEDGKVATIESSGRPLVTRKIEKLVRA